MYVFDVTPLDPLYCYGHKVFYVDKTIWYAFHFEAFDRSAKVWKFNENAFIPAELNSGESIILRNAILGSIWDLQGGHVTTSTPVGRIGVDKAARPIYQNAEVMAFPAGLALIMR